MKDLEKPCVTYLKYSKCKTIWIQNSIGTFENSHGRFAVTETTHYRSTFCERDHRNFGWWFDTVNTNCQNCVKKAFKIAKLSLTEKNTNKFHSANNAKK